MFLLTKEIIYFYTNPSFYSEQIIETKEKIRFFIHTIFLYFIFLLLSLIIINVLEKVVLPAFHIASIFESIKKNEVKFKTIYPHYAFWYVLLFSPFIEELIFRLPLKLSKINLLISFFFVMYISIGGHVSINHMSIANDGLKLIVTISATAIVGLLVKKEFLNKIQSNYFSFLFYLMALCFTFIHISNFSPLRLSLFFLYPLYVLPQLFAGLFISQVRIKCGFMWGLLLHCLINVPAAILIF